MASSLSRSSFVCQNASGPAVLQSQGRSAPLHVEYYGRCDPCACLRARGRRSPALHVRGVSTELRGSGVSSGGDVGATACASPLATMCGSSENNCRTSTCQRPAGDMVSRTGIPSGSLDESAVGRHSHFVSLLAQLVHRHYTYLLVGVNTLGSRPRPVICSCLLAHETVIGPSL